MKSTKAEINNLINELADAPFKYAKNDCYVFTAKLVKAWHGVDLVKLHDVYSTKKEAVAYIKVYGGIETLTTGTLGYSIHPEFCKDGDVVTAEVAKNEIALGFVISGHGIFKAPKKIVRLPLDKCRKGWRIT